MHDTPLWAHLRVTLPAQLDDRNQFCQLLVDSEEAHRVLVVEEV